jgi:hypothetical protein
VIEAIPAGTVGKLEALGGERSEPLAELELFRRISEESGRPLTFTLVEIREYAPDPLAPDAGPLPRGQCRRRALLFPASPLAHHRVHPRPFELSRPSCAARPTSRAWWTWPPAERVKRRMRDPELKRQILAERDVPHEAPGSMQNVYGRVPARRREPLSADRADQPRSRKISLDWRQGKGRGPRCAPEYLDDAMLEDEGRSFQALTRDNQPEKPRRARGDACATPIPSRASVMPAPMLHADLRRDDADYPAQLLDP